MKNELYWIFKNGGILSWIPLVPLAYCLVQGVILFIRQTESLNLILFVADELPIFAFFWVCLSLLEPLLPNGGDIFFVYRKSKRYWVLRTVVVSLLYALPAMLVAAISMQLIGFTGWMLPIRVFWIAWFYACFGYLSMSVTRDFIWAVFLCIGLYVTFKYGRWHVIEWFNIHRTAYDPNSSMFPHHAFLLCATSSLLFLFTGTATLKKSGILPSITVWFRKKAL